MIKSHLVFVPSLFAVAVLTLLVGNFSARAGLAPSLGPINYNPVDRRSCGANKANDLVSINVGFDYRATPEVALGEAPGNDLKYFSELSQGYALKTKTHGYDDTKVGAGVTKDQFLSDLSRQIASAKVVNFNYSGHGLYMPDGQFALVLPSLPADLRHCVSGLPGQRGMSIHGSSSPSAGAATSASHAAAPVDPTCANLNQYLITSSDLAKVFGSRKSFGVIDACHAGAFSVPNSSFLLSAGASEYAHQNSSNTGGEFTDLIKSTLNEGPCGSDLDGDGQVSMHELTAYMQARIAKDPRVDGAIGPNHGHMQNPVLNDLNWTDCYIVSKNKFSCARDFKPDDPLQITAPTIVESADHRQTCILKSGDIVHVHEALSGQQNLASVELPSQRCGFSVGLMPSGRLRKVSDANQDRSVSPNPSRSATLDR